jgi:thiosulfate/3-mercaptopyruvate sulfurtransferase
VEKELPRFPRPGFSPADSGSHLLVGPEYVSRSVKKGVTRFVDARTPDEFSAGHIPGAVSWPWRESVVRDSDSEWLKPVPELRRISEKLGLSPEEEVICYCNTGVQASHVCFVLRLLGFRNARLYTGSWDAWEPCSARR